MTRRRFIANSAAAAVTIAAAAHVRGDEAPKSAALLRFGIIGTGTRGNFTHVTALKVAPECEIAALCDVAEDRLAGAAGRVGKPVPTYPDYQKLLADPNLNAVVIAAPNLLHREILLAALQAGKHVLCEKPAGVSFADAGAMQKAAEAAKTVVMFGMQYRHNPKQQKIRELIDQGRIGKPKYIVQNSSRGDWNLSPNVWQYSDPKMFGGKPTNWRFFHAASGGTLNEFDCHYFDLIHWYAGGLPTQIEAEGGIAVYKDGRDTWDHGTVTMRYGDDVTAVHTISLFGPNRTDFTIMGDEGSIDMKGDTFQLIATAKKGDGAKKAAARTQEIKVDPSGKSAGGADPAVLKLYEDFVLCAKTGKKADASPARAVAASRTCWLAELAAQRQSAVKWDEATA